jgi:hypothetical protein
MDFPILIFILVAIEYKSRTFFNFSASLLEPSQKKKNVIHEKQRERNKALHVLIPLKELVLLASKRALLNPLTTMRERSVDKGHPLFLVRLLYFLVSKLLLYLPLSFFSSAPREEPYTYGLDWDNFPLLGYTSILTLPVYRQSPSHL